MRLIVDARMLGHSGIGVYLTNVLRAVVVRCADMDPLVFVLPGHADRARALLRGAGSLASWSAAPLGITELRPPRGLRSDDLWWSPHFNVPLASRIPLVVTLHDLLPLGLPDSAGQWLKRIAVRTWLRAIRTRARRVVCVSEFTRREAVRLAGLRADRVDVIPLGVDAAWARSTRAERTGAPYLIFVGLVKPHKNLLGLLRAFESIADRVPHRLIVVGRHVGLREVDRAAVNLARRLAPRVELRADVPQSELIELVAGADLLVQPSFHEGFGLPPLEAMAARTPVLAARAGAMPEVCGDAAAYCDPRSYEDIADRMLELFGNAELRATLRERGAERARAFTWERCAQATSDAVRDACMEST